MISHPMRRDSTGAVVTVDPHSRSAAAQLALHVIACAHGERPLAPGYGLPDPLASGVSEGGLRAALAICEPEIDLVRVDVTATDPGRVAVRVDVEWSEA